MLLAFDTATPLVTVALHDGASAVAEATTLDSRAHAEHLAPGIRRVLAEAGAAPPDVTDVVVGIGPGPFTGLRVGIVTGRTFAFALGRPCAERVDTRLVLHAVLVCDTRDGHRRWPTLTRTNRQHRERDRENAPRQIHVRLLECRSFFAAQDEAFRLRGACASDAIASRR